VTAGANDGIATSDKNWFFINQHQHFDERVCVDT
jgi:hypothetical protein